ncbi:MAG: hypothetical protein HYS62_00635 [Candidatus Aenigmarchaeota archaeon]|nr:hypothetical protein [Candidatus Aenigmarchaeota archaeon]
MVDGLHTVNRNVLISLMEYVNLHGRPGFGGWYISADTLRKGRYPVEDLLEQGIIFGEALVRSSDGSKTIYHNVNYPLLRSRI